MAWKPPRPSTVADMLRQINPLADISICGPREVLGQPNASRWPAGRRLHQQRVCSYTSGNQEAITPHSNYAVPTIHISGSQAATPLDSRTVDAANDSAPATFAQHSLKTVLPKAGAENRSTPQQRHRCSAPLQPPGRGPHQPRYWPGGHYSWQFNNYRP